MHARAIGIMKVKRDSSLLSVLYPREKNNSNTKKESDG